MEDFVQLKKKDLIVENKEFQLTPEFMKFFDKIIDLKSFVKKSSEELDSDPILKEIYQRLDEIIKTDSKNETFKKIP